MPNKLWSKLWNNKFETLLCCFMKIVPTYGIPNQVRSDKRKENVLFTNFMIANREPERASLTCGKSIHNQHIESL